MQFSFLLSLIIVLYGLCVIECFSCVDSGTCSATMSKYLGNRPVFVAGGSNGVGLEVVKQLSQRGTPVHALVRRKEAADFLSTLPGVKVTLGDAFDADAIQRTMEGCVAAITTLGDPLRPAGSQERVDYVGNSNVIEQAGILGVERLILVTSVGCGDTIKALSPHVYNILKDAIVAKNKAERDLHMYTNMDWTIIRPGGLKSQSGTGHAIVTEDIAASGYIHREDVASLILQVLASPEGRTTRKELTAVDPSLRSDYTFMPFTLA